MLLAVQQALLLLARCLARLHSRLLQRECLLPRVWAQDHRYCRWL